MWFDKESEVLEKKVLDLLYAQDGLTDQEIAEKTSIPASYVRAVCGQLKFKAKIERKKAEDRQLKNFLYKYKQ